MRLLRELEAPVKNYIKNEIKNYIKEKSSSKVMTSNRSEDFKHIMKWLKIANEKKYEIFAFSNTRANMNTSENYSGRPKVMEERDEDSINLVPCNYTFMITPYTWCNVKMEKSELFKTFFILTVRVYGQYHQKIISNMLNFITKSIARDRNNITKDGRLHMLSAKERYNELNFNETFTRRRTFDSYFLSEETKNRIVGHIDSWIINREIYYNTGMNYKMGLLFHGPAGTGKSSLIKVIASIYEVPLVSISLNIFDTFTAQDILTRICEYWWYNESKFIVIAFEDFDAHIVTDADTDQSQQMVINKRIHELMQLLDGNVAADRIIYSHHKSFR